MSGHSRNARVIPDPARTTTCIGAAPMSSSALADIEMLAHEWLVADKPHLVELNAGRRIGDSLVATAEHRVIQLRRADDFVSGRTSHTLVQQELKATTTLLDEATLTEDQTRRLLTATGELAQLAAWVAADAAFINKLPDILNAAFWPHTRRAMNPWRQMSYQPWPIKWLTQAILGKPLCSHAPPTPAPGTVPQPRRRRYF